MIVRTGEPDDIPALQAIEKKARTVYGALAGFEFVTASPPIAADRLISGTTFVAEVSGSLVGFALIQPMDGALYLANISVLPDASKRGVGARLIERVIAHARARQATAVTLATFRAPPWNGPWFRRLGFTTMPESEVGTGLLAVLTRHASFLDMQTRETLWFPVITVPSVVQNSGPRRSGQFHRRRIVTRPVDPAAVVVEGERLVGG
jgi:N-acetylglutamate synthase-like GNAT family acetyltransferase